MKIKCDLELSQLKWDSFPNTKTYQVWVHVEVMWTLAIALSKLCKSSNSYKHLPSSSFDWLQKSKIFLLVLLCQFHKLTNSRHKYSCKDFSLTFFSKSKQSFCFMLFLRCLGRWFTTYSTSTPVVCNFDFWYSLISFWSFLGSFPKGSHRSISRTFCLISYTFDVSDCTLPKNHGS